MNKILLHIFFYITFANNMFAQSPLLKQWDYRFGGSNDEYLTSLHETLDHGFVLGGLTASDSSGDVSQHTQGGYDYWVVKTDSVGNKLWDKRFGGINDDYCLAVQPTNDGGYILGGRTDSDSSGDVSQHSHGGTDFWLIKIDSIGHKLWDKCIGGNNQDIIETLEQTTDGGFMLGGVTISDSSKNQLSWN